MKILGIDPGTATTGYGIIEINPKNKSFLKCIDYGCITTLPNKSDGERLKEIETELKQIINIHKPDILAVERIFFFKNQKTIITVSQAKGVIILTATKKKIPVIEFSPVQVKMAVSGYGRAEKKQIQRLIQSLLNLDNLPKPDDAADALGIAICCSQTIISKK